MLTPLCIASSNGVRKRIQDNCVRELKQKVVGLKIMVRGKYVSEQLQKEREGFAQEWKEYMWCNSNRK
jgi:hypothetical protein